jgi:hypothetical protein
MASSHTQSKTLTYRSRLINRLSLSEVFLILTLLSLTFIWVLHSCGLLDTLVLSLDSSFQFAYVGMPRSLEFIILADLDTKL